MILTFLHSPPVGEKKKKRLLLLFDADSRISETEMAVSKKKVRVNQPLLKDINFKSNCFGLKNTVNYQLGRRLNII